MTAQKILYQAFGLLGAPHARKFSEATKNYKQQQLEILRKTLSANEQSAYGRRHGFKSIHTVRDFQHALPINDYTAFEPYITRSMQGEHAMLTSETPVMFATTSGTLAAPKFLPVTPSYLQDFRRASVISGYNLLKDYPQIAHGNVFSMTSRAVEGLTPCGTPYGAISGLLFKEEPWYIRKFVSPIPYETYVIDDYETRYYCLLRLALQLNVSCIYTLNPSTIKLLMSKMRQYADELVCDIKHGTIKPPRRLDDTTARVLAPMIPADPERAGELKRLIARDSFTPSRIWSKLGLISCWTKAAAAFYLGDLRSDFGPRVKIEDISYGASEGRGTVYGGNGKQVLAITSHFFEFIPESEIDRPAPTVLLGCDLEAGKNYYVLFTTSAGLYRYHINDVLKVTGFCNQAPMLEFQYKGGNICSFTGEKVTELQAVQAMERCLQEIGTSPAFFTIVPQFKPSPHYELWIEIGSIDPRCNMLHEQMSRTLDDALSEINIEYAAKRQSGRLGRISTRLLELGTYEKLRKHLCSGGIGDAQIKISHLNPRQEVADFLADCIIMAAA